MAFLKIGDYIINEDNITHIDLNYNWEFKNHVIEGVGIWFTSPYHYPDDELQQIVNIPYCLKIHDEEHVNAIRYYYKVRNTQVIDLESLYKKYN